MKYINISAVSLVLAAQLSACGGSPQTSDSKEAWDEQNNPLRFSDVTYVTTWNTLPLTAALPVKGWSDDYWATMNGGISYRWLKREKFYPLLTAESLSTMSLKTASPAEKYDVYMDRLDFPLMHDERGRTKVLKTVAGSPDFEEGYKIPRWEGLCHGWAPAAMNFKEPVKTVVVPSRYGDITFYPSDIKALLTYYQQYSGNRSTSTSFIANRCNINFKELDAQLNRGEITKEQWHATRESIDCRDMNAGALHVLLANEIGLRRQSFIADVTRDAEVWNQPVNSFQTKVVSEKEGASEGAAQGTVKEITVQTKMSYSVEIAPNQRPVGAAESAANYEYVLELNAENNIIGGRWISTERPDFAWRETTPKFRGYFAAIWSLYQLSIAP